MASVCHAATGDYRSPWRRSRTDRTAGHRAADTDADADNRSCEERELNQRSSRVLVGVLTGGRDASGPADASFATRERHRQRLLDPHRSSTRTARSECRSPWQSLSRRRVRLCASH
jgi:hypothetical protein